ncbi:putative reverse transcriptase domain-containing protein [Tanacetum coccineum]
MIRETTGMIVQIKNRLLATRSRQKSYADVRRKPLEFKVGDKVMLKVSPWKGVVRFGKRGKLSPRYIGPFKILSRVGPEAYKLNLPRELQGVRNTFHVSNLKKCLSNEDLIIPLYEVRIDEKLHFIEEPIEIMDREVKQLKQSRIPIVKVRWNSSRGPEYTWEREDQMSLKIIGDLVGAWKASKGKSLEFIEDLETKMMKETPYELLKEDQKKQLRKNNKAKMTLYNALPRNSQVKNCKIDLLTKEYEKFSISNKKTIDGGFTRFNAIMTSFKSLDPDYSSKNHVRNFLRTLPLKWRAKVTAIEEAKDLATLPLDELIGNLKVNEMVLHNDDIASKTIKEKTKSLAIKSKVTREQTSDDSDSQGGSDEDVDEEKAEAFNLMARNFRKFFCKGNRFGNGANRFGRGRRNSKVNELELEVKKLARSKEVIEPCQKCVELTQKVDSLKSNVSKLQDEALNFSKFKRSSIVLDDMLSRQKLSQDREGLGFSKFDKATSVCLKCDLVSDDWIVDSGYAKHMPGNRRLFTSYKVYDGGHVIFGRNLKGKVVGGGDNSKQHISLATMVDNSTLWNRRLGYTNMRLLQNLASNELVRNLPKLSFERYFCDTCGPRSQVLNKETMRIEESPNVSFDESLLEPKSSPSVEDDRINEPIVQDLNGLPLLQVNVSDEGYPKSVKEARGHPIEQGIGELNERTLRSKTKQT